MRSLQTKVTLLLTICFLCCSLGLLSWQHYQQQTLQEATEILRRQENKRAEKILSMLTASLKTYGTNYSFSNSLSRCLNSQTGCSQSDLNMLDAGIGDMDGIWVFDSEGRLVYGKYRSGLPKLPVLPPEQILTAFNLQKQEMFLLETPSGILQLSGITINEANDHNHENMPHGYLFAGRLWDKAALDRLGVLTGSNVTLSRLTTQPTQLVQNSQEVEIEIPLVSYNGTGAYFRFHYRVPLLSMQQEVLHATSIWVFCFSSALFLALSIGLYYWISSPLKLLTGCLSLQTPEALDHFQPDTHEVSELTRLVRDFFWQKHVIQQDRDLLEVRVEDRTQALRDAMNSMSEMQAQLQALLANLPVVVFALDEKGIITFFQGKGMQSIGIDRPQVVGRSVFRSRHFRSDSEHGRRVEDVLAGEERSWNMLLGQRYFDIQCSPLHDDQGKVTSVIGVALDVTERVRFEDRLLHQAQHDALTGLPNRRLFQDRLDQALTRGRRDGRKVAILFLDLDNFKLVNDTLGHEAGDQLLKQITHRITRVLGPSHLLARLGGDEFTVVVEHFTSTTTVERLAERIRLSMEESFELEGQEIFCRSSVGVVYSTPESSVGEMLRNADIAMYRSKEEGKGCYTTFDESMNNRLQERLVLEADLRHALQNDELTLCYQPIVSLQTGQLKGVEALARWQHPRLGAISPIKFVAIAEEAGISISLDYWALRTACRRVAEWNQRLTVPLNVSVNISTRQFQRTDLDSAVQMILRETGLKAENLTLEITEGVMMQDPHGASDILRRLKLLGVQIAIDDFGTGYSSMAYLSNLPLDTLKIDRSFISQMIEQKENAAIVEAIIHMARALSLKVTSEGVETEAQVMALQQLSCHQAQGFLFSEPLTDIQLEQILLPPLLLAHAA